MAGAFTEFGRKSTQYKVTVFVVVGVILGALYFQFAYKSAKKKAQAAKDANASALKLEQKLDADARAFVQKKAEADQLARMIAENQKALPTEAELPAFFDTLGRKVSEAGVQVKRWDYLKEVPTDTFIKVPLEIEVTGSFFQIEKFFASLIQRDPVPVTLPDGTTRVEDRERIVTVENFQLIDPKGKNGELALTARFTASTFRQEQTAAPPDDKAGAAKPGTTPTTTPTPTPGSAAPPAATPAGAKAATDDAMKKDATRSDDKLKGGVP